MDKVTVKVATPVKADGKVFMPGEHEVSAEVAAELNAAGVLETETANEPPADAVRPELVAMTRGEIDQMVATRAQIVAETMVEAVVKAALSAIEAERDAAVARAEAAEARIAAIDANASAVPPTAASPAPAEDPPKTGRAAKG